MENILGNRIKELRKEKKMSQQALAEILNITASAVSTYEKGLRQPSGRILTAIANYFGVSARYLLGETNEPFELIRPWDSDSVPSDFSVVLQQLNALYNISSDADKALLSNICSIVYNIGSSNTTDLSTVESFVKHWQQFAPLTRETNLDTDMEHIRNTTIDIYNNYLDWAELAIKLAKLADDAKTSQGKYDISKISPYDLLDFQSSGFAIKKRDL